MNRLDRPALTFARSVVRHPLVVVAPTLAHAGIRKLIDGYLSGVILAAKVDKSARGVLRIRRS